MSTQSPTGGPNATAAAPLSGRYRRHGQSLRRPDGRCLLVCLSSRPPTARRPGRYVQTVGRGSAPRYVGSLYADSARSRDDLDKTEFQDREGSVRYRVSLVGPDAYDVAPVQRRRAKR